MYKERISPVLDRLDSERMHVAAREGLHLAEISPFTLRILEQFAYGRKRFSDDKLRIKMGGVAFDNPVMVGAGWDKAGRAVKGLYTLGFSGVEVGSVLKYPQPGNEKPRQFILAPGVALNRLGFNTPWDGLSGVARNLERYEDSLIPIGINVGKNKDIRSEDTVAGVYADVVARLYSDAYYFAINVSSPNTSGLRALQDKGPLTEIVKEVNHTMDRIGRRKPLFVKIAPELTNEAIDDVIQVVLDNGLTGIIATNTTTNADIKKRYGRSPDEPGGVSGDDPDFRKMATDKVAHIYKQTKGKIEIIGVGGIKDTESALDKIKSGAKIVQIVTGIRGEGTTLPGRINSGLVKYMERTGIKNIKDLVGTNFPNLTEI